MPTILRAATPLFLCLCLGARSVHAQEPAEFDEAAVRADMERVLQARDRVRMEGGARTETVGLEQGDNDLRSRTPALKNSDHLMVKLDLDEQYQRTLALYSKGRFSAPPTATSDSEGDSAPVDPVLATPPEDADLSSTGNTTVRVLWAAAIAVLAAIGMFAWRRTHAAQSKP